MTLTVVGRGPELARLAALFADDWSGERVALIEGEPGTGKTTLWTAALDAAASRFRVLRARPTGAEATYAYAGLGDIFESVAD
ncbi:MAG TPA: AAA family ATPase, partial [Candidatus Binatia bacterium]|nr:AAA family ATPase [Candidatus Binatia bacterium]